MPNTHQLSLANRTLRTGVTTSLNTGDDGTYKKGILKNPRFVDNGDGTISDRATGLMWVQDVGKMATGTPGRLTKNQVVTFRGAWSNSISYSVGDCVADPQTGDRYICFQAHTSVAGATDWSGGGSYYPTGSKVRDAASNDYWESLADHYSISEPSDIYPSTYYNSGDIVRDPLSPNHYWQAGFSGYSISNPSDWSAGSYYNYGDKLRDTVDGKYYTFQTYGYSISDPGSWSSSNYYNSGDYRYVSGYSGYGYADGYYYCQSYHYSSGNFADDVSNGYWYSSPTATTLFELDRVVNSGNWSYTGYDSYFALERGTNSWSEVADHLFALDRYINSGNWTSISNTFTMANDRAAHPTYWEIADFVGSSSSSYPTNFTYTNALSKCEALSYAGYTDWRMPNAEELSSFMNYLATTNPLVDTTFFKNITSASYHSSTPYASNTAYRWGIYLWGNQRTILHTGSAYPVLPVRGG